MEEIKKGDYVRTKSGIIARATSSLYEYKDDYKQDFDNDILNDWYNTEEIVKHSENIEELLEIDDILLLLLPKINKKMMYIINEYTKGDFIFKDIKEKKFKILKILTKEQFEEHSYKVEG